MSDKKSFNIMCPSCGAAQDVELYEAINVVTHPELKQALLTSSLNGVECEECNARFRIDMPLLYSDPENKILIHWIPETNDLKKDQIIDDFDRSLEKMNEMLPPGAVPPVVRLVLTRIELIELISMVEASFNQRIIEYVKYTIYTKNRKQVDPLVYGLLLNVQESTEEELHFVMQTIETSELGAVLKYGRVAYQSLCDLYKENPDEFLEMFPGPYISARDFILEDIDLDL